jgi:hypothetical protein
MSARPASAARPASGQPQHQQHAAPVQNILPGYPFVQQPSPLFSLQRVISEHVGILRVRRLLFIGERCPALSVEAFKAALSELKSAQPQRQFASSGAQPNPAALSLPAQLGPNPSLYADVVQRAHQLLLTPGNQPEHQWFLSAGTAVKGILSSRLIKHSSTR